MNITKAISPTGIDALSTEEVAAIIAVWSELPNINIRAREPELLLSRLVLSECCLKLASKLEASADRTRDTALRLTELREIVILQIDALEDYDGNPHAKVMLDRLTDLMDWWSAQPHKVDVARSWFG